MKIINNSYEDLKVYSNLISNLSAEGYLNGIANAILDGKGTIVVNILNCSATMALTMTMVIMRHKDILNWLAQLKLRNLSTNV